jgi:hypothetical protein
MDLGQFRHVPIMDDQDHPVGLVSVRNLLQYLAAGMRTARGS